MSNSNGNVLQDTFEKLGELAKDSGKAVADEPKKILEGMLGGDDSNGEEQGSSGGSQSNKQSAKNDPFLAKKKQEDEERSAKLLQLHRQRLREEEEYQRRTVTEEEREEMEKQRQKEEEEQTRIIQLRKQDAKDVALNTPTAASGKGPGGPMAAAKKKKGTKELGRNKD